MEFEWVKAVVDVETRGFLSKWFCLGKGMDIE